MGCSLKQFKPRSAVEQRRSDGRKGREGRSSTPKARISLAEKRQRDKDNWNKSIARQFVGDAERNDRIKTEDDVDDSPADYKIHECELMLDNYIHMSIGLVIITRPSHPCYPEHMGSILRFINGNADSSAALRLITIALRAKGRELGMQEQADQAANVLHETVWIEQGKDLGRKVLNDVALVALNAGILAERMKQDGFDASEFFRNVKNQLGLPAQSTKSTPLPQLPDADDPRVRPSMPSVLGQFVQIRADDHDATANHGQMFGGGASNGVEHTPLYVAASTKQQQQHPGRQPPGSVKSRTKRLLKVAQGVDLVYSRNALLRKSKAKARNKIAEHFRDGHDLYLANDLAFQEWKEHRPGKSFDAMHFCECAERSWTKGSHKFRLAWQRRYQGLFTGDLSRLAQKGVVKILGTEFTRQRVSLAQRLSSNGAQSAREYRAGLEPAWNPNMSSARRLSDVSKRGELEERRGREHGPQDLASEFLEYIGNAAKSQQLIGVSVGTSPNVNASDDAHGLDSIENVATNEDFGDSDTSTFSRYPALSQETKRQMRRDRSYFLGNSALERSCFGDDIHKVPRPIGVLNSAADNVSQRRMYKYCADALDGFTCTGITPRGDGTCEGAGTKSHQERI